MIFPATKNEVSEIRSLIDGVWEEFETVARTEKRPDILHIPDSYHEKNGQFFVYKNEKNEIIGTVGVHQILYQNNPVGFLRRFFFMKHERGKGRGLEMMETVENFCREQQWEYLMFGVDASMEGVKNWYKRNGYEEFSNDIPQELIDDNDEWYLRKKL